MTQKARRWHHVISTGHTQGGLGDERPDRIGTPEVNDRQSIAIVSGATQQEAAEKAGVQRTTVTEWCNHNFEFKAERNPRRQDRLEAAGEQLRETLCAALVHLGEKVRDDDIGAAMAIVKAVGVWHLLRATKPGPTTPAAVKTNFAKRCETEVLTDLLTDSEFADTCWIRTDLGCADRVPPTESRKASPTGRRKLILSPQRWLRGLPSQAVPPVGHVVKRELASDPCPLFHSLKRSRDSKE